MKVTSEKVRLGMDLVRLGMDVYNWAFRYKPVPTPSPLTAADLPPESLHGPAY